MTSDTTPEATELEQLLEATIADLREAGLSPTEFEVEYDNDELWGYIWLAESPADTLAERKETAEGLLRDRITTDADILPTVVNINYGDAGDYGIAVWWT